MIQMLWREMSDMHSQAFQHCWEAISLQHRPSLFGIDFAPLYCQPGLCSRRKLFRFYWFTYRRTLVEIFLLCEFCGSLHTTTTKFNGGWNLHIWKDVPTLYTATNDNRGLEYWVSERKPTFIFIKWEILQLFPWPCRENPFLSPSWIFHWGYNSLFPQYH